MLLLAGRHGGAGAGARLAWVGLVLCCCCCLVDLGSALEFTGAEGQWATFPMWNACCESEMSFNMKTRSGQRGGGGGGRLLVYFDDDGFCDFLELLLRADGKLSLRFSIFCADPATVVTDTAVDDGQWHSVTVRRSFKNTTLVLDRREVKWVEVKSKRRDMTVFSQLFLGGIPPDLKAQALRLTSQVVKDTAPFAGWITDLRVNNTEPALVSSAGVIDNNNNDDLCGVSDILCLNGGVCSVVNDEATCDCTDTGYQGKDCSEEDIDYGEGLAHLMMGDQGRSSSPLLLLFLSSS
ncbi:neurexin-1a-like, partial [Engraulis encrasicolus]|uniref:neurexin-1a-like n=1 Tax=Engraulis encrasicolus TaxID=184585 RepID=UPI002FCEC33D